MTPYEADKFFFERGAVSYHDEIMLSGMDYWRDRRPFHLFRHYFRADGLEAGYVTIPLLSMENYTPQVFESSRVWGIPHDSIKLEVYHHV